MIGSLVDLLVRVGVAPRFARPLLTLLAMIMLLTALGSGKCAYDRSIIRHHTAKQDAVTARADRAADATAADQRRVDDARAANERNEIKEAIDEARSIGVDPRAAYYQCVQLQQAARRLNQPPADC